MHFRTTQIKRDPRCAALRHGLPFGRVMATGGAALVAGHVVDGLVPVAIVRRLLRGRPAITGITLPGMPLGAPGMDEPGMQKRGPFVIHAFGKGAPFVYARE